MRQSSYTEKLRSNSVFPKQDGMHKVNFKVQENEFLRLSKAFVGLVENSRILYNEGYFSNTCYTTWCQYLFVRGSSWMRNLYGRHLKFSAFIYMLL